MKRLFWVILALISGYVGYLALREIYGYAQQLDYAPLAICVLLAIHGFVGTTIYLINAFQSY